MTEPHIDGEFDEGPDALLDALVRGERAAMKPPEGAQGQTWERVAATVATGGPPPLEPTSITGSGAAAASAPWAKIVLGLVLGVAAVGGYRLATAPSDPSPAVVTRAGAADELPEPAVVPAAMPRAEPPVPAELPAVAPPEPPAPEPVARATSKAKAARNSETRDAAASTLAEETRLLAQARRRLAAGSARDALVPLREHARRFPSGQLTEDRMVLQAQALCESGQTDQGLAQASALRKAFPRSSHLPRVDRACAS